MCRLVRYISAFLHLIFLSPIYQSILPKSSVHFVYSVFNYISFFKGLARSSEDDESWGQYGGSYGGSKTYYKDRSDFQTSLNHWRLSTPKYHTTEYAPTVQDFDYNNLGNRKHEGHFDYGHWRRTHSNRSEERPGLTYGESNYYRPRPTKYYPVERSDEPKGRNVCLVE